MRVLLLNPSRAGKGNIPVNLPVLHSVLTKAGHQVRVFDFTDYLCFQAPTAEVGATDRNTNSAPPEITANRLFFKPTDEPDAVLVRQDRRKHRRGHSDIWDASGGDTLLLTGDPTEDFDSLCSDFRPEVVAVSCLTVDFPSTVRFLRPAKIKHGFHLVFGGIHAITLPDHAIAPEVIDSICVGEGEDALPQYLERFSAGGAYWETPNMWVRYDGQVHRNDIEYLTDMADLPYMDFDEFDPLHFYRPFDGKLYRMVNYEWGRGCPYSCTYCENVVLNQLYRGLRSGKGVIRRKPAQQSIAELEHLVGNYGFNFVRFWDEDFTAVSTRELEPYAELYKKRIGLPFLVYARAESLSRDKAELLADMGCVTFAMGIESGCEFIRRTVLDRQLTNRQLVEKFSMAKDLGIRVSGYNIIGLPRENRRRIFETIELNRISPIATSSCTLLEPYPATPIRPLCEEEGLPQDYYPSYQSFAGKAQFIPKDLTRDELEGLFKTFALYVHLPRYLFPLIEIAEKDTPEGRSVFDALLRLKAERFADKPVYENEAPFEEMPLHASDTARSLAIPNRELAAQTLMHGATILDPAPEDE